ncbi:MAG: hypothetical protein ACJAT7_001839, partial [Psychromonas sp.]
METSHTETADLDYQNRYRTLFGVRFFKDQQWIAT